MMKGWVFLFLLLLLTSCQTNKVIQESSLSIVHDENIHLKVEFDGIEHGELNNESGFYVNVIVTSLYPLHDVENDYTYMLDRYVFGEDQAVHEAQSFETSRETADGKPLNLNQLYIRQFFTPSLKKGTHFLDLPVYVKPTYYRRNLIFNELHHDMKQIEQNDFRILSVETTGNKLFLQASDAHNIKGVEVTLLSNSEKIFPSFQTTSYDEERNIINGEFEFAEPIVEPFQLSIKRHRLEEQLWTLRLQPKVVITSN